MQLVGEGELVVLTLNVGQGVIEYVQVCHQRHEAIGGKHGVVGAHAPITGNHDPTAYHIH